MFAGMLSPKFLEILNGSLFIILIAVEVVFGRYIVQRLLKEGWRGYFTPRVQAATSIFVVTLGDTILRAWFWYWRVLVNQGHDVAWIDSWPVPLVGWIIQFFGAVCLIRVFSPEDWTRFTWAILACIAIAGAVTVSLMN